MTTLVTADSFEDVSMQRKTKAGEWMLSGLVVCGWLFDGVAGGVDIFDWGEVEFF